MLSNLDIDVIFHVLAWLEPNDILTLRKTSKQFNSITHLRTVWYNALINFLADNVPIAREPLGPGDGVLRNFTSLSTEELEQLVLSTSRTSDIWEQQRPVRTRALRMRARVGRVHMLRFLRLRSSLVADEEDTNEGRYLLSFGHTAVPTFCMQIWDVEDGQDGPGLVAERSDYGRVIGLAVDEGNGLHEWALSNSIGVNICGALIAVAARCYNIPGEASFVFRIMSFSPSPLPSIGNFYILKSFRLRGPLNVRAMHGSLVVVHVRADSEGQAFGHGVLKVVDWVRSTEIFVQAQESFGTTDFGIARSGQEVAVKLEPSVHGMNRSVLRVHFVHDWILVFRESVLEMYFLPPSFLGKPQSLRPAVVHKWNWQINSLAVTERTSWVHDIAAKRCRTCDGRGFIPAPADAGRHSKDQHGCAVCRCRYRPLSIAVRFDSFFPWPVNFLHHFVLHVNPSQGLRTPAIPYVLPPALVHTVPSTVRLFRHSVLVLGRFGTLLWKDSEAHGSTEGDGVGAYFAEETCERVAGRRLPLPPSPEHTTFPDSLVTHQQDTDPNGTEPPPAAAHSDTTSGQTMQTSLFAARASEGWRSLALCESLGRIAVGDGEGNIDLWDHF